MRDKDDPDIRGTIPSAFESSSPLTESPRSRAGRPRISVSGFCSGVGKTSVVETILRVLHGAAALKVTVVDSAADGCPIERPCGVCASLGAPFEIVTDRRRLTGKDTGRYIAAGADPVVWIKTRASALAEAVDAALQRLGARPLIVEGNTPVPLIDPDIAIMVDRAAERREIKPSAARILPRIDLALLNCPSGIGAAAIECGRRRLATDLPGIPVLALDARGGGTVLARALQDRLLPGPTRGTVFGWM
jgi:molybdopterin-guanine dinucleotide biosynthesis protein